MIGIRGRGLVGNELVILVFFFSPLFTVIFMQPSIYHLYGAILYPRLLPTLFTGEERPVRHGDRRSPSRNQG